MAMHPEIQKRAQQEVDQALRGENRLPTFKDKASLPLVNAIVKELLRWGCVAPVGLPHCSAEEDEYRGYRIPKGTVLITNIWFVFSFVRVCGSSRLMLD